MNVILVRFGEIFLKGKNRWHFENLLVHNIKIAIEEYEDAKINVIQSRYYISGYKENEESGIIDKLQKVFGIHSISKAIVTKNNLDDIKEVALSFAKNLKGTFKVQTNRADKTFPLNSIDVSREVGGYILEHNNNLEVDVHEPNNTVYIDIRENGETFIYQNSIKGLGGLPVGSGGEGLLMLSGGIDSPVSSFLMNKRGMHLNYVHFFSYPYTSESAKQKVIDLANILKPYNGRSIIYMVPFTNVQLAIHKNCKEDHMITIMRRIMVRIAEKICKYHKYQTVITGESLGQVASQTIESITSTNEVASLPILRPVIAFDKDEIMDIARKIGTYETSILPYEDCCTVFLPKFPVIKPNLNIVHEQEEKLDIDSLIKEAMSNIEKVEI